MAGLRPLPLATWRAMRASEASRGPGRPAGRAPRMWPLAATVDPDPPNQLSQPPLPHFRSRGGGSPGPTDGEYNYEPERTPPNTPTSLASRGLVSPCTRGGRQGIGRFRT